MELVFANSSMSDLFNEIALGNEAAYEQLFIQYRTKIYSVAFKFTKSVCAAEDITQDVFIAIWKARTKLSAVEDAEAYMYTAVYNRVSKYLKKESNTARILAQALQVGNRYSNLTEEMVYANESQKFINKAIEKLSPQKKLIYQLNRQQGKSYDEIAEALHLSTNTVKTHMLKAVKSVRYYLKKNILLPGILLCTLFQVCLNVYR